MLTTPRGYRDILAWAESHGEVEAWGIEGTGCYGAGLARFLRSEDQVVIEINRPDRKARRLKASPIPSTPRPRPGRCCRARPQRGPSPVTTGWR